MEQLGKWEPPLVGGSWVDSPSSSLPTQLTEPNRALYTFEEAFFPMLCTIIHSSTTLHSTYIHTYINTYIHTYTHTYTHTRSLQWQRYDQVVSDCTANTLAALDTNRQLAMTQVEMTRSSEHQLVN